MPIRRHQVSVKRLVQILLAAGAFCALIWLAITRWNGVPVIVDASETVIARTPIDPKEDRTEALLAAFAAIPPEPMWTLPPPPPGRQWKSTPKRVIDPGELIHGTWSPATRPHMQAVIDYLLTPEVEAALAAFIAFEPGGCRIEQMYVQIYPGRVRRAAKLLVGRARYHHAGREDVDAAIVDLSAALRLSGICQNSGEHLLCMTGTASEQLVLSEIQFMSFERRLTRSQVIQLIEAIETAVPQSESLWRNIMVAEVDQLLHVLDTCYTLDDNGDGWIVLSELDSIYLGAASAQRRRSGAWNLLSPIFNSRKTVTRKIEGIGKAYEGIDKLSFSEGRTRMKELAERQVLNILDGPLRMSGSTRFADVRHTGYFSLVAYRCATVVAAALSAYRADHGTYPASLSDLVGDYLMDIPLDPFDFQPMRYIAKPDEDDFILYSVGRNLTDNGGQRATREKSGSIVTDFDESDIVYGHTRWTTLWSEIELEDINP